MITRPLILNCERDENTVMLCHTSTRLLCDPAPTCINANVVAVNRVCSRIVLLGLSGGLLDEATSREPAYHYLYFEAYRYFQPQWYGSDDEVDELARYAAARSKRAEGRGMYARFYWQALDCNCDVEGTLDWPTMKLAMRDVMARYPADWNAANFARIACRMNDADETAAWLGHVSGDPSQAWDDNDEMRRCLRKAQASPAAAERSSQRCAYAAIEQWPNEDFERYCRHPR